MEYICLNCGRTVETEHGELENLNCKCGGDLVEAERCCNCGKLIVNTKYSDYVDDQNDIPYLTWSGKYICRECIKKRIDFDTAYRYITQNDDMIINFLEYYYEFKIDTLGNCFPKGDFKVLWNYRKENYTFFDDIYNYICEDLEDFACWLEEEI